MAGLLFFLTAASAALFLFDIKQQVREMEEELGIVHRDILRHQEAIQVLKTEWSYLNRPARIADLAERHLGLRPLTAGQFVRIEDLPMRAPRSNAPMISGEAPAVTLAQTLARDLPPRNGNSSTAAGGTR